MFFGPLRLPEYQACLIISVGSIMISRYSIFPSGFLRIHQFSAQLCLLRQYRSQFIYQILSQTTALPDSGHLLTIKITRRLAATLVDHQTLQAPTTQKNNFSTNCTISPTRAQFHQLVHNFTTNYNFNSNFPQSRCEAPTSVLLYLAVSVRMCQYRKSKRNSQIKGTTHLKDLPIRGTTQ